MTLVLDTSILIDIEKKNKRTIEKLEELSKVHYTPASITFINYFEFYFSIMQRDVKNKQYMLEFINKFNCLRASNKTAEIFADLKYKCDVEGIKLPLANLIIASQVKENDMILVTKDRDFEKITEIKKVIL